MFNLPNLLTLSNLLCGSLAIVTLPLANCTLTAVLFAGALIFDFLDGMAARWLNQKTKVGLELDSLADMVSFGFFPGVLLYQLIQNTSHSAVINVWPALLGFSLTLAAALRLAKFNLDERQSTDFMGLNTPAVSLFVLGIYLNVNCFSCTPLWTDLLSHDYNVVLISLILSFLLLIDLPMLSFKITRGNKRRSRNQIIFFIGLLILGSIWHQCSLPFLVLWYIIFSTFHYFFSKK